jgi:GNAT superfamily N-acetyltransferase
MEIRAARPGEDVLLSELAFRSSQEHWNYPPEFMEWEPESIAITPDFLTERITNLLEIEGRVVGFYVLSGEAPEMELSRMMIEPDMIGKGYGRLLWDHAVETARSHGVRKMTLDADPNAEAFYQRMGAVTTGELDLIPPMLPDWRLKAMEYEIDQCRE